MASYENLILPGEAQFTLPFRAASPPRICATRDWQRPLPLFCQRGPAHDAGREGADGSVGAPKDGGELNVLVVDDQPINLQLVEAALVGLGLNVVLAQSGFDALDKAQDHDFALVLMDIRMPSLDGIETASLLREQPRHAQTPIIFVTAYTPDDQEMLVGYQAGAVDYLFKPLIPQVLRAKVSAFVDLYRKNQESKCQAAREAAQCQLAHDLAQLEQMAHYDALTGLANRKLLMDRLEQELASSARHSEQLALLFLDLDHFKQINDSLGHDVGDCLLREVAARLRDCVRKDDTVARLGGDEFVILLTGLTSPERLVTVAEKIVRSLASPFPFDTRQLYITTSVGISIFPDDGEDGPTLLKNADLALYRAKAHGRNNYQLYTEDLTRRVHRRVQTESALRGAIDREEFALRYQPKLDLQGRCLGSVEALVRWRHEKELLLPEEFIPLAEETGLVVPLGEWVLREVCRQIKEWDEVRLAPLRVAVNLSIRQFQSGSLVTTVERLLREYDVGAHRLELEITESVAMHDVAQTVETVQQLRSLGIHLAMDDFGTGYSSLKHLQSLPLDSLKIDQSFIRDVTTNRRDLVITRTIIAMARSLGMHTIAEGVETAAQLGLLESEGCDTVQGYLISAPVSPDEIVSLVQSARHLVDRLLPAEAF